MRTLLHYLLVAFIAVVAALAVNRYEAKSAAPGAKETTYERALRTGEIRCAYAPFEPDLIKDANTGELSGIFYDVLTEIGRRLNLKISWVEEVGYGVIPEGFVTGRYDAFCSTIWPTPDRSRAASFSIPLFYSSVDIFVRNDDHRFDSDISKLNDPSIRFAGRDGDVSSAYAKAAFPLAAIDPITQLLDTSQILDDVVHNKADAAINSPELLYDYLKKNPGTLRDITAGHPLRVSANTIMIGPGQYQFKVMLDTTLQELLYDGTIEKILKKYDKYDTYLRIAKPYAATQ